MISTRVSFRAVLYFAISLLCLQTAHAQYDPQAAEPIGKLRGSLVLHGGGELPEAVIDRFMALAGGKQARLVIVPTAAQAEADGEEAQQSLEAWKAREPASLTTLHAATKAEAGQPAFLESLQQASGVWFLGGQQSRLAMYAGNQPLQAALRSVIERGGVVGGSGAGAAALGQQMIVGGTATAELQPGLALLPGAIIDQHFLTRQREPRLMQALQSHPGLVGLGIDEGSALVVTGRALQAIGNSSATLCLAASKSKPARSDRLLPGKTADLIALNRSALARADAPFPTETPPAPEVPQGALVIIGGGGMPKGLMERFVELAGGKEAQIVYLPCAEEEVIDREPGIVESFRKAGVKSATWLHTKDRQKADQDAEFLAPLKTATGIFFGGGRQWNLVDSYQNTTAHKLMHDVLARGGVIGGSSAGASIQGDYMPRGDPLGNLNIIAEGYERGLGFLTGVGIDQHFTQRKRQPDMTLLMRAYPQLLGIGLDETTAIVVQKHTAEVVGANRVAFYDAKNPPPGDRDYVSLKAGEKYDLQARKVIEQ